MSYYHVTTSNAARPDWSLRMSEPPILYELASEPDAPDLTIAAAAIACRMGYTAVNQAVVDYMNGERQPVGTPDYLAVLAWRAVTEYVRIAGDSSHSAMVETGQGYQNT